MRISFTKMHGAGNDYLFFDCLGAELDEPQRIAQRLCDRHFGVGADGIVLILPSEVADAKIRIFNADGSEAPTCGNALRCVGRLLYESTLVRRSHIRIETLSGVRELFLTLHNGRIGRITVNMGRALLGRAFTLGVGGEKYEMRYVEIGNGHRVTLVPDVDSVDLARFCESAECDTQFPLGVNTELCEVVERNRLRVRVLERGSGETLACGSGACAAAVAAIWGWGAGACDVGRLIKIYMRGGELGVLCTSGGTVYLSGEAEKIFEGSFEWEGGVPDENMRT